MAKPKIFIVLFTNENIRDVVWEDVIRLYYKNHDKINKDGVEKIWSFIGGPKTKRAINIVTPLKDSPNRVKYSSIPPIIFTTHKDYYTEALYSGCEVVKVITYDIFSDCPEKLIDDISKLEVKTNDNGL